MSNFEEKVRAFFKNADLDGSGGLSKLELCKVLNKAGDNRPACDIIEWFSQIDKNNDDKITVEELLKALSLRDPKDVQETELRSCFKEFDSDNSGYITADELRSVFKRLGVKGDADKILAKVDKDKDGKINFEEFIKEWKSGC